MIRIPEPINEALTFRWFVEFTIDNGLKFRTASGLAKASLILGVDLDTVGSYVEVPKPGLKLLRETLEDEESPLPLPPLENSETKQPISPRIWQRYLDALLTDVEPVAEAAE